MSQNQPRPLNRQQLKAIEALMTTGSLHEAADAAGIGRATLYRWLRDTDFLTAVRAAEGEALENVSRALLRVGDKAVRTLESTMDSATAAPSVKVKAADVTLARMTAIREIVSLEARLADIEARLANMPYEARP